MPLRLSVACELFFGNAITPATLRTEHRKGNLAFERIAGKDFVTPKAIQEMRDRCRVQENPLASSYERTDPAPKIEPLAYSPRVGSSETGQSLSGRDVLRAKLLARNRNSSNTSERSTTRSTGTARLLPFESTTS
ncbi:hypothetical protein ACP4J4_10335 [Aureimonas ureilytica]|uniref:hypothetical protein n=1 Tax=Aureimonas ureilytica TaxID=401562 RepID=UPI003CF450E4